MEKKLRNKVHPDCQIEISQKLFAQVSHHVFLKLSYWEVRILMETENKSIWNYFFSVIVTKRWGDLLTEACGVMSAVFSLRCSKNEYFLSLQTYFIRLYFSKLCTFQGSLGKKSEAVKCYNYVSTCPSIHSYLSSTIISCSVFSFFFGGGEGGVLQIIFISVFFPVLVA